VPKEFTYRGHTISDLQQMSMDEFIRLLPARQRRSLTKGLTNEQRILLEQIRRSGKDSPKPVKTHCRDMVVLPEMVGKTLLVHDGKEFGSLNIKPEMIGHYLGEFVITNKESRTRNTWDRSIEKLHVRAPQVNSVLESLDRMLGDIVCNPNHAHVLRGRKVQHHRSTASNLRWHSIERVQRRILSLRSPRRPSSRRSSRRQLSLADLTKSCLASRAMRQVGAALPESERSAPSNIHP